MSAVPGGYAALLRLPGAAVLLLLATTARFVYGVLPLALLLLISGRRGSYTDAGLVLGLYALTAGLGGPARSRLVDRVGPRHALGGLTVAFSVLLAGLVVGADAPLPVVAGLGLLAGCCPPPVGPTMRTLWRRLTDDSPDPLRRAYALDAVTEEASFVAGPVVAAVASAWLGAAAVLLAGTGLLAVSVVALALRAAPLLPAAAPSPPAAGRPGLGARVVVLLPMAAAGLVLGGLELAGVALLARTLGPSGVGVHGAALSAGSVLAGLVYGRRRWPGGAQAQAALFAGTVAVFGLAGALAAAGGSTVLFVAAAALVGAACGPALVATYLSVDSVWQSSGTEATAWVNSTFNGALAGGTAVAGALVDRTSPATAVAVVSAAALALTVAAARAPQPLRGYSEATPGAPPR